MLVNFLVISRWQCKCHQSCSPWINLYLVKGNHSFFVFRKHPNRQLFTYWIHDCLVFTELFDVQLRGTQFICALQQLTCYLESVKLINSWNYCWTIDIDLCFRITFWLVRSVNLGRFVSWFQSADSFVSSAHQTLFCSNFRIFAQCLQKATTNDV